MIQDDYGNLVSRPGAATINEKLSAIGEHLTKVDDQMLAGDERMTRIEAGLTENTVATQQVADNTKDLVELFQAMKGALKVLNWLGKLAKPMAYIIGLGTAALGFWTALKGHMK